VVHEDQHIDVKVYVFSDEERAYKMASRIIGKCATPGFEVDDTLYPDMINNGWLFHAVYSEDGDSVRVEKSTLLDADSSSFDKEH
jgi:hypothetical protein